LYDSPDQRISVTNEGRIVAQRRVSPPIRFGSFELDPQTAEIRRNGSKLKLEGLPFQLLAFLVERPGDLVTREELREKLWRADTFVDFEHGINTAVRRVREVLGDSADAPRFIETLPRRGYRFICPIATAASPARLRSVSRRRVISLVMSCVVLLGALGLSATYFWRQRPGHGVPHIASIAVLPCANLSGDPDQDYVADGLTDEMTASLSRIDDLTVKSRTSAMTYKGTTLTVPEIAAKLNVEGIVECSVRRSGDKIDITVKLIEAANDAHLWARTYRRDIQSVITVQDDAARDVAREIAAAITPQKQERVATRRTVAPEAYQAYLKGRHHFLNGRMQKAAESFSLAVSLDAGYAEAYAGLGASYSLQPSGGVAPVDSIPKARAAAVRALQIDEGVGEAHAVLGWTSLINEWNWSGAENEFTRALELNPSDDVAHMWYGCALVWEGDFERGLAELRRAQELAPAVASLSAYVGMGLYLARQYQAAVRQLDEAIELGPDLPLAHAFRGLALSAQGSHPDAIGSLERAVQLARTRRPENLAVLARLGYAYAAAGQKARALAVIDDLRKRATIQYVPSIYFVMISAGLGDTARALEWLDVGVDSGDRAVEMLFLKVDPRLDSLRSNPRFLDLMRRVGFDATAGGRQPLAEP
jgi:TolB-like protein/DNA-binding winged helix-turn-helix (wHTH) protein